MAVPIAIGIQHFRDDRVPTLSVVEEGSIGMTEFQLCQ